MDLNTEKNWELATIRPLPPVSTYTFMCLGKWTLDLYRNLYNRPDLMPFTRTQRKIYMYNPETIPGSLWSFSIKYTA